MQQRINVITLGVRDLIRAQKFYEDLGWKKSSASNEQIVFFQALGLVFALYPDELLAEDAKVPYEPSQFRGVTLAYTVADKGEVQEILDQAKNAGGKILKNAQDVFWGGYSGYFSDLDGHLWEVAWNPFWPLQEDGTVQLP